MSTLLERGGAGSTAAQHQLRPSAGAGHEPRGVTAAASHRSAHAAGAGSDTIEMLRAALPALSSRAAQAAEYLLAHPDQAVSCSAARLAADSGTSVGTIVRLCQQLGLPGIQALKLGFAASLGYGKPRPAFDLTEPGALTFARMIEDLTRSSEQLDFAALERVAGLVHSSSRVLLVSSGTSQALAVEFGNWLTWSGHHVSYPSDSRTQAAYAARLEPGDLCFGISHSGVTPVTVEPLVAAAGCGAATIALTSYPNTPIARVADIAVIAGAPKDANRDEDTASRMVHHAVLQVIRSQLPPR